MGYDYTSIHVFADSDAPARTRAHIIAQLPDFVSGQPVPENDANRSVVVGPSDRWIFVGDTCSGTEDGDAAALDRLIHKLSTVAPTLAIHMSDSACVHLYLRHAGELIDKFGTGNFPFYPFNSDEEAASFRGVEGKWAAYALHPDGPSTLRSVWDTRHNANGIVQTTAEVLGIHPELAGCGFTIFDEAEEIYFRDWVEDQSLLSKPFDVFHFQLEQNVG
ncbi:hypothetical protein [Blastopirellula marina]|uniref:Uncharacterized protein n=1 Tax=Blastopirellula marina DSM 3645 TaxID=314230 RepID=A3ZN02_9BACT|nr:hypothetical protein [Blastopirellula marina]EAQ82331.1 hypothetical protein DSM3645_01415 [Blastopirellula marina DSM 3645]